MKTILVVDDLASVRFYHQSLLKQAGYATLSARDGLEAVAVLEKQPVDLVLLDLLMPKMNGTEFLKHLRASARFAALPVGAQRRHFTPLARNHSTAFCRSPSVSFRAFLHSIMPWPVLARRSLTSFAVISAMGFPSGLCVFVGEKKVRG